MRSANQILARAFAAHQAGHIAEAAFLCTQVLRVDKTQFDALHMLAMIEARRGNFAAGLRRIDAALRVRPNAVDALINRACMQSALGDPVGALATYQKALALNPQSALAHSNMSVVLRQKGQGEDALAHCDAALAVAPDYADAWNNRGNILCDLKRWRDALASYDRAIAVNPELAESHVGRGNALRRLSRYDEAVAAYDRALTLKPGNAETLCNWGVALAELNCFDAAEAKFRRAIALNPGFAGAYHNLGLILRERGQLVEAEAEFRRAIALNPGFAGAYNDLGLILKERGRLVEARQAIEQAIRLSPATTSYYDNLGEIRSFVAGDPHITALERLAEQAAALLTSDRIHLHFALAKAYEHTARFEDAFRQLLAANALKRRQIAYDEPATLARMERTRAVFTRDFIAARHGSGAPSPVPVFIVGMPRSGTTLIEQILASHPDVYGAGELVLFEQAARAIGNAMPDAQRFPDMVLAMSGEHFRTLATHYLDGLLGNAPKASRIVDKMPGNFLFAGLIHLALPQAAIIHAVRDPIDTCVSCFSVHFSRGQPHTSDMAELGRYYRHYRALMAHWHRVLPPGRIFEVHYEDLVDDIEGVARCIVAHCGLAWNARCLDFHRTERSVRTASAAQVRQPIYKSSVGRWRRYANFLGPLLSELEPSSAAIIPAVGMEPQTSRSADRPPRN
jgi:tetratricopeptide (TPR) repeat protein